MTGNAIVVLTVSRGTTSQTYKIETGTSITAAQAAEADYDVTAPYVVTSTPGDDVDACAAPSSSGPNSAGNDNCQWMVTPSFNFDTITLSTELGTVTLEGSGDFANNADFDSLFYLSNAAPTAVTDTVSTDEDTPLIVNVLANDSDGDGDALTASLPTVPLGPLHGTVAPAATAGSFTYVPAANYSGLDSFTYVVTDGTDSSTGTVNITVVAVNDRPIAVIGSSTTPEDTAVTIGVGTDIDSTTLTSSCTSSGGGTIVDNGDGTIRFTPLSNFAGTITLTCSVTDDHGATSLSSATVTVGVTPVNDPPSAVDDSADVDQNGSVIIPVVANDADVDLDTLVVDGIVDPPENGTATASGGTVTYEPDQDFIGTDSFTYTASDGAASSNAATVIVSVYPVMCSEGTVTDNDGDVTGTFFRLTDSEACKRYVLEADAAGTVLFTPTGAHQVEYRGYLSFGPVDAPTPGGSGELNLLLEYDPTGGTFWQPVQWCINPQFEAGAVTSATMPSGQTWCIASESTQGDANGDVVTTWQVYGQDDPRFQ